MSTKKTTLPKILPGMAKALQNAKQKIDTHRIYIYLRKLDCWWHVEEIIETTPQTVTIRSICLFDGIKSMAVDTIHLAEIVMVRVCTSVDEDAVENLINSFNRDPHYKSEDGEHSR